MVWNIKSDIDRSFSNWDRVVVFVLGFVFLFVMFFGIGNVFGVVFLGVVIIISLVSNVVFVEVIYRLEFF